MPTYEITGPNGKKYRVTGDSPEGALNAVKKLSGGQDTSPGLSEDDRASPLPDDLIAKGRATIEASKAADEIERKAIEQADQIEKYGGETGASDLFGNSFTLGMQDKVAGLAGGVGSLITGNGFKQGYNVSRRAQEILEERARARSGSLGTAAEIAGSVGTGVLAKGPAAVSAVGRILQTGREAATLGAMQGVGDSRSDTLAGTAGDALVSGAVGGATGAALGTAVEVGRGLYNAGRAAVRGAGSVMDDATGRAERKVYQALVDDGLSPDQAVARMANRDTALINVADENTLGLGRAASAKPGPGRTTLNSALDAQQRASRGNVQAAVDDALGGADIPFNQRVADMIKTRSNLGKTAYDKAFAKNFENGHSMVFDELAARIPGEAVRNAQKIAKAEGRALGEQLVASIDDAGNVTFARAPSIREWHYIQRGLRSAADSAYRSGVGEVGTAYKSLHKELLGAMDEASPLYKTARAQYSSQSDMLDAIQRGREILLPTTTKNVDALGDELAGLSKAEKEMVRIGLARQMQDMIEATPDAAGDMVKKIFGTQAKRSAIRAVFDDSQKFRAFEAKMGAIAKEVKSFQFVRTGARSSFVDAEKQNAGILADAAGTVMDLGTKGVVGTTISATAKILKNLGGMDDSVAAQVAKLLVERNPDVVKQALTGPASRAASQAARAALVSQARPFARALAVGTGATTGSAVGTMGGPR